MQDSLIYWPIRPNISRCGGARVAQWVRSLDLTAHTSLSPIRRGFAPSFANYKKGCTRLAAASDKVYQLLAHGRWFSPGIPASSTTKTGRHDIAEILLKVALNTIKIKNRMGGYYVVHRDHPSFWRWPIIIKSNGPLGWGMGPLARKRFSAI
jgi:hypothetical protein